jgi:threonine synthase
VLIERGAIPRDESLVVCITGNGYKTAEALAGRMVEPVTLGRSLKEFEDYLTEVGAPRAVLS